MTAISTNPFFNQRKEPRFSCVGSVVFVYKKNLDKGKLQNWSRSGLCMKTNRFFRIGEEITVSLPQSKFKINNRKAKIIWKKSDGCGLKFSDE